MQDWQHVSHCSSLTDVNVNSGHGLTVGALTALAANEDSRTRIVSIDTSVSLLRTELFSALTVFKGLEKIVYVADEWLELSMLPRLKQVFLWRISSKIIPQQIECLSRLPLLTSLIICNAELTAAHLTQLLPHLHQQQELKLFGQMPLTSLSFLTSSPTLADILATLQLPPCSSLPLSEARLIDGLRALRDLGVCKTFTPSFDKTNVAMIKAVNPNINITITN